MHKTEGLATGTAAGDARQEMAKQADDHGDLRCQVKENVDMTIFRTASLVSCPGLVAAQRMDVVDKVTHKYTGCKCACPHYCCETQQLPNMCMPANSAMQVSL